MNFAVLNWRAIMATFLFFGFLKSSQYHDYFSYCSLVFSIVVIVIGLRKIYEISKNYFPVIGVIMVVIYFIAKISTTAHFNQMYKISPEYLNYSVIAKAGITGSIAFLLIFTSILLINFVFKIEEKPLKKAINLMEALIHLISLTLIIKFLPTIYQTLDKYDVAFLYLDAYEYNDCQATEGKFTIRKDNEYCYLFKPKWILEWELEPYQSKKP